MREMKDSGIPCIGEVSKEFQIIRLKNVAEILDQFRKPITADQRNQDADVLYDYYGASGVIDKIDGYTIDDHVMLIGEDGANLRMRNLPLMYEVNGKAWINNHAHILKPKNNILFRYLFLTLEGLDINPYITGSAQPKLNQENLRNIWLPVPPINVQQAIVDSLDCEYAKVDALITNVLAQIEKLKAYKQSLITEVVTKGLDPTVPMKDSGIEWVKRIPSNWDMLYPKALFIQRKDRARPDDKQLTASQQYGIMDQEEYMAMTGTRVVVVEKDFDILKHVEAGDFVISMRSFQGGLEYSEVSGCISSAYVMLKPSSERVYSRYYRWLLKSSLYINAIRSTSNLVRDGQAMRYANFIQIWLPCPAMEEQKDIADYLDDKCPQIDRLIAIKQTKIEKLEQYKRSLIYEYVTGKKEVPAQN